MFVQSLQKNEAWYYELWSIIREREIKTLGQARLNKIGKQAPTWVDPVEVATTRPLYLSLASCI